ncbi:YtzI protein [Bacillus aerolatus]|uniref:YtzI protein n=1 Tax=Bacillus aerolatus TaxID=2653354 RepID=A0A6I1FJ17_9BACI|nr:YtzI protein [Bacillus aerolatus]KAB7705836.1 YtzI protein [Bacillus aerolatus]
MAIIMTISFIIIAVVILLSVFTVNKGYQFKHTIDPIENNPHLPPEDRQKETNSK